MKNILLTLTSLILIGGITEQATEITCYFASGSNAGKDLILISTKNSGVNQKVVFMQENLIDQNEPRLVEVASISGDSNYNASTHHLKAFYESRLFTPEHRTTEPMVLQVQSNQMGRILKGTLSSIRASTQNNQIECEIN